MAEMTGFSLENIAIQARKAFLQLSSLDTEAKNQTLVKIADALDCCYEQIQLANNKDLQYAGQLVKTGELSEALYKRLALTESKFKEMVNGVRDLARLPDPVGQILMETELDDGLILKKISCPIGVIGVIFESRPDVVVQISSLAIKSANAVILKGGSEAINTNVELVNIINRTLEATGLYPEGCINLIITREDVKKMLELDESIDLIIPRGSNAFVKYIQDNTRIPVLGHSDGICHVYVDREANMPLAEKVCLDSKIDYPAACNAVETILVHNEILDNFLPQMVETFNNKGVEVRVDAKILEKVTLDKIKQATEEDWQTEYNDMVISIKGVESKEEAIEHINKYGSGHTDSIITVNKETAEYFMDHVDSAGVYWNASTRFADGYRYGFGAEVGISTNKTHARGPVGLEGLMIYKYKLYGNGHIVSEYSQGDRAFTHRRLR